MTPDYLIEMISDCEQHDTEWGRSCFYCGSQHGRYDAPLEHYIDCLWLRACADFGIPVDEREHIIFEPRQPEPCAECGWFYCSKEDWRGRERPICSIEWTTHASHLAAAEGLTVEEWERKPFRWSDFLTPIDLSVRGGIAFVAPPSPPYDIFGQPGAQP